MANFFKDNDDLRYYFDRGIDWDALVKATERGSAPSSDAPKSVEEAKHPLPEIAEMVGEFVAEEIAPHTKQIDHEKVRYEGRGGVPSAPRERVREDPGDGAARLCAPRELGGMNAPLALYFLLSEMFARADVSVMAHHGFHGGMAAAMLMPSPSTRGRPSSTWPRAHRQDPLRQGDPRDRPRARRGAAWTSPSPTPGATWRASAAKGELGRRRQLWP
jgi:alkylation response protein AidB-like acyl-CoA dehydrogenase